MTIFAVLREARKITAEKRIAKTAEGHRLYENIRTQ